MPRFEIIASDPMPKPQEAADNAESKAAAKGGEQVGIAATVCCGSSGTDPAVFELLKNMAVNIYNCDCPQEEIIGHNIKKLHSGTAPPVLFPTPPSPPSWVVFVLIKHP